MRFALTAIPALLTLALGACTIESTSTPSNGSSSSSGGADSDAGSTTPTAATLPFKASNISLTGIDASKLGDVVVSSANCSIHSETFESLCVDSDKAQFVVIDQPSGGGKIGVYVARSWRIEPNAGLKARGTYALALVALDDFDNQGTITVAAETSYASAGGFVVPSTSETKGGGEGGGGPGSSTNAGGGGSYCGAGGKGAAFDTGTAATGGTTYGSAQLVPLVGGSAGGNGVLPSGGTGGGAIQIVAGKTFTLGANAVINAGGGGGGFWGAPESQHASGGGSGGAILIEAGQTALLGSLLAEGGAGGSKEIGQDARADGAAAASVKGTNGAAGGNGSGAGSTAGGDGTWLTGDRAGGGGGGAGRIRVNTTSGDSGLSSAKLLSPNATGACLTEGKVAL